MKEFSDSLPASELEHLRLNMFNYFRKYICVLTFKLNEEENETTTISNFLRLFCLHVTNNILKTKTLKIEKKTSIEAQSEGHALVHKTRESH